MKLEYDPQADAAYITLIDSEVVESEQVKPGVVLDYDAQNRIVGVEILHVRKQFPDADTQRLQLETA